VENYGLLKVTPEGHKFLKKPKSFKIVEDADFEEEEVDETPMRSGASCAVDPVLYSMLKDFGFFKNLCPSGVTFNKP
jgi:ATP-dependent DNA helicase RecQ